MWRMNRKTQAAQAWALTTLPQGRWRLEAHMTREREVEVSMWALGRGKDPKGLVRKWRLKGQRAAVRWHTALHAALEELGPELSLPEVLRALPNFHRFKAQDPAAA